MLRSTPRTPSVIVGEVLLLASLVFSFVLLVSGLVTAPVEWSEKAADAVALRPLSSLVGK